MLKGVEDKVTSVGTNILINSLRTNAYVMPARVDDTRLMEHFLGGNS